jgi:GDP-4-dehydro-6-deoxy-D-mannose reductase
MKTVFITGSSGFVGGYLRKEFENQGYKVVGTDLRSGNAEYLMDVTKYDDVVKVLGEVRPDYVIHLAGFASVKASFNSPELCMNINVGGTKNVLDALMQHELFQTRVLIISSSDVYDDQADQKLTETSPIKVKSPYGQSRIDQENLVKTYTKLDWIISRSFPHIGPGQPKGFVTADFASQIADIEKGIITDEVIKVGNLGGVRDFTDVRDTVKAYRLLLEKGKSHEIYNVCSSKELRIAEILNILLKLSQHKFNVQIDEDKLRPFDVQFCVGSNSKLVQDTGWTMEYNITQTLNDIYQYWFNASTN